MALPFLRSGGEEDATRGISRVNGEKRIFRGIMWVAVILCTISLGGLSITGAWIASGNAFYTTLIAGVEITAFAALTCIVFAATPLRKIAGWAIFIAAVTVCIINAERAIEQSFDLNGSAAVFRTEADLLDARADTQEATSAGAQDREVQEQDRLRNEIASLNLELDLMSSDTRIKEAQRRLQALGLYGGPIDGLKEDLTDAAMLQRGEAIRKELALAQEKLRSPSDATVSDAADVLRVEAAEKRQKAEDIDGSVWWIRPTLAAIELIRSFAAWAFLIDTTMVQVNAGRQRNENEATNEAEASFDPDDEDEAEPEPKDEPWRKGLSAAALKRAVAKGKLPIGDTCAFEAKEQDKAA